MKPGRLFFITIFYLFCICFMIGVTFNAIHKHGFKSGQSIGYEVGHDIGYKSGFNDGYIEGYDDKLNIEQTHKTKNIELKEKISG